MLDNINIGKKLMLGFSLMIFLIVLVSTVGSIQMHKLDAADTRLFTDATEPLGVVVNLGLAMEELRMNLINYVYTGNSEKGKKWLEHINTSKDEFEARMPLVHFMIS